MTRGRKLEVGKIGGRGPSSCKALALHGRILTQSPRLLLYKGLLEVKVGREWYTGVVRQVEEDDTDFLATSDNGNPCGGQCQRIFSKVEDFRWMSKSDLGEECGASITWMAAGEASVFI